MREQEKGILTGQLTGTVMTRTTRQSSERTAMRLLKKSIIFSSAFLIVNAIGCANVTNKINQLAVKHDTALTSAVTKINTADSKLASIKNPPAEVTGARADLKGAAADIKTAQDASTEITTAAKAQTAKVEKLEKAFFSVRQKQLIAAIGVTIALIGLVIVLIRFGGMYGAVASIPILGAVVAKISFLKPKE